MSTTGPPKHGGPFAFRTLECREILATILSVLLTTEEAPPFGCSNP